jgi:predicted NUDIX family phosphoesterase
MQDIMVFPRHLIDGMDGFFPWMTVEPWLQSVSDAFDWMPRDVAECSRTWVQPIPCAILRDPTGRYCVFRQVRQERWDLSRRLSFVVGGHVDRPCSSGTFTELFADTVKRELLEEVGLELHGKIHPVGVVVDGSSLVGSRHVGFVHEVDVLTDVQFQVGEEFSIRSKYDGMLFDISDRTRLRATLDPWSSLLFSHYMDGGFSTDIGRQLALPWFDNR